MCVFKLVLKTSLMFPDAGVTCPQQETLTYDLHHCSYADVIESTYSFASKRLLELLMKEKDLMGRLRFVLSYLCNIDLSIVI